MSKIQKLAPAWHTEAIAELKKDFGEINALENSAAKRRAYLGLKLIFIKEKGRADNSIPHNEWVSFFEEHFTGITIRTAQRYMTEGESVAERMGWQKRQFVVLEVPPHRLLELPAAKLEAKDQKTQQLLFDMIDERGRFQRRTVYNQVDEKGVVKRGQLPGSKGNTKKMRLESKFADDKQRMEALAVNVPMVARWLAMNCNATGFPQLAKDKREQIIAAIEDAHLFFKSLAKGAA